MPISACRWKLGLAFSMVLALSCAGRGQSPKGSTVPNSEAENQRRADLFGDPLPWPAQRVGEPTDAGIFPIVTLIWTINT